MPKLNSDPMWCVVMFDLPVTSKSQRREATRFRNNLLDLGFSRAQFSVYVQYLPLSARINQIVKAIKAALPPGGDVRIISITDIQWSKAVRFSAGTPASTELAPPQLTIF